MSGDDENLIRLLASREVIGQAIAVLMDTHEVSRDGAFEMLVQGSAHSQVRVREIAAMIVEQSNAAGSVRHRDALVEAGSVPPPTDIPPARCPNPRLR